MNLAAPWLSRPDWASGRIECPPSSPYASSVTLATVVFEWLFISGWLIVAGWIGVFSLPMLASAPPATRVVVPGVALLCVAGACGLVPGALRTTRQWTNGRATFEMATTPGVLGGKLTGRIHAPRLHQGDDFEVVLACRWNGGQRRFPGTKFIAWKVLWHERHQVSGLAGPHGGATIPVSFELPFDLPESEYFDPGQRIRIFWRLEARPARSDVVLFFDVPVFKTADSQRRLVGPAPSVVAPVAPDSPAQPARSKIRIVPAADGAVIHLWQRRVVVWSTLVALAVIALAFAADQIVTFTVVPFWLRAGLASIAALFIALNLIGLPLTPQRLEIAGDLVTIRTALGPVGRTERIRTADITAVKYQRLGGDPEYQVIEDKVKLMRRTTYSLAIHVRGGHEHCAASRLQSLDEAQWLAAELQRRVGLAP